ncbi:MAG: KTSC domain-containing protein [Sulfurovum sp.]
MKKTLTKVASSMVYALGYDVETKDLEVVFNTGKIWIYEDVANDVYEDLLNSDSVGSFMRDAIIGCYNEYPVN